MVRGFYRIPRQGANSRSCERALIDATRRFTIFCGKFIVRVLTTGAGGEMEKATFAAGCFWGVEADFRRLKGVASAQVGYTGGTTSNATYKDVCTGRTGHAEAVEIEFDPAQISYDQLLNAFWELHDPTTPNRQGPDVGTQYRSAIFYHSPAQEAAAKASRDALAASGKFKRPIVTEIKPATQFWRAEEYHQPFLEKRGEASCHLPGSD